MMRNEKLQAVHSSAIGVCLAILAWAPAFAQPASVPGKLKVYICVDMEGVAGVVTSDQLKPEGFEYERFRRFMTDETLAAINAAKESGASEILVADSHGNGESLLIELLPPDVRVVRSWPRHGEMMGGLDASFDAALLVGIHASTTSMRGVRAHTFSSANFTRIALNGEPVSESEFNAAFAGSLGVPVVFAAGDDAALAEVKRRLPHIGTVETKQSLSFHAANTLTPAESARRIGIGVRAALASARDMTPFVLSKPITLEIAFKHYQPAEILSYLRAVQRTDSHTIRFVGKDMAEVADFLSVVGAYSPDLAP
jgi:D-amino peptidase